MTEPEPEFPYVFKCKKCEEQHIAISLQPWMIEWLKSNLEHYVKDVKEKPELSSDNIEKWGGRDNIEKYREMEAGIANHILEVKIKPALEELIDKGLTGGYMLRLGKKGAHCGASAHSG